MHLQARHQFVFWEQPTHHVSDAVSASEGRAWGAALLAAYRDRRIAGEPASWEAFLASHSQTPAHRFTPRPAATATLDRSYARHRRLVASVGSLS
jgi:hypothetical protein